MRMKKKTMILAASLICIVALLGGTLAYTVISDTAKSTVTASNAKIDLTMLEEDANGNRKEVSGDTSFVPGATKSRIAIVKNTGKEDVWVRVSGDVEFEGDLIPAMNSELISLQNLSDSWTYEEGFWYYNERLAPGQSTEPLFDAVKTAEDIDNGEHGQKLNLKVDAFATQCKYNGGSALEAEGWPSK